MQNLDHLNGLLHKKQTTKTSEIKQLCYYPKRITLIMQVTLSLARGELCRLLITFTNILDPDLDRQNLFDTQSLIMS